MAQTVTKHNYAEIIESATKPVILKASAEWCGPCIQVKPIFDRVAEELRNTHIFALLNVDEERDLAIKYGITSIPCFIFIKNNKVMGKEVGFMTYDDLVAAINRYFPTK
jgi:thioredoxin 1